VGPQDAFASCTHDPSLLAGETISSDALTLPYKLDFLILSYAHTLRVLTARNEDTLDDDH